MSVRSVVLTLFAVSTTLANRAIRRHSSTDVDCAEVQRDLNAAITRGDAEFALPPGDIRCDVDFVVLGECRSNKNQEPLTSIFGCVRA